MVVRVESYCKIADELERQEVINGGVLSNNEYAKLLTIYLLQSDLLSAKFLWKRIPLTAKSASAELEAIWKVGRAMRKKDYDSVYSSLKHSWSQDICPLMLMVEGKVRQNIINLVGKSYSSLEIEKFRKYLGCDLQEALSIIEENGWSCDAKFVFPKPIEEEFYDNRTQFNAFEKLTDSISFLEN